MHLPDGVLSEPVCLATSAAAAALVAYGAKRVSEGRESSSMTSCAVVGGAIFVAQAANFPIGEGVSGHLVGSVLAAAILGPWTGFLVVAAVLAIQASVLGDGGLTTLGANILNMAAVGSALVAGVSCLSKNRLVATSLAAASMPLCAAGLMAVQFALSGHANSGQFTSQLYLWHLPLSAIEGLCTLAILAWLPRLSQNFARPSVPISIVLLAALTVVITLISSQLPDPLESALAQTSIAFAAIEQELSSLASVALMVAGLLLTMAAAAVVSKLRRRAVARPLSKSIHD